LADVVVVDSSPPTAAGEAALDDRDDPDEADATVAVAGVD
jgi:hypothetical protein